VKPLLRGKISKYSRTPIIRINWGDEVTEYVENPDNWIFL